MERRSNKAVDRASETEQYALGIWLAVTLPMPILGFVVTPLLGRWIDMRLGLIFTFMMAIGLMWQFVVTMWVLRRERRWPK